MDFFYDKMFFYKAIEFAMQKITVITDNINFRKPDIFSCSIKVIQLVLEPLGH